MPVPLRTNRAQEKYNVTTEFPHLGLHSAAATGNVGLVKYALSHGQPINSVLDGVLPLHAASSGGSDIVVKLLIENGADVNAPRLPRRYSNDRNRSASAPIVGTSGSTPLHFAAANGHINVVSILLHHGAHSNRPDKHGVTPEFLARENGWIDCAELLKDWSDNMQKDFRERSGSFREDSGQGSVERHICETGAAEGSMSKRVRVKRSIDNALNILKPGSGEYGGKPSFGTPPTSSSPILDGPPSPDQSRELGEYSFYPVNPELDSNVDLAARRPSLPHLYMSNPSRKSPVVTPSPKRPSSAGTGAEPAHTTTSRKVATKYSLLNLFKKAQDSSEHPSPDSNSTSRTPASAPISIPNSPNAPALPSLPPSPVASSFSSRFRVRHGSDAPYQPPLAVELHHHLAQQLTQQGRDRSNSGASISVSVIEEDPPVPSSSSLRPGILRSSSRSSSSVPGFQLAPKSSLRALRFDSTSSSRSASRFRTDSATSRSAAGLRACNSVSSLRRRDELPIGAIESGAPMRAVPDSAPAALSDFEDIRGGVEEDEEEYGKPIVRACEDDIGVAVEEAELKTVTPIDARPRGQSFASSLSSLSPIGINEPAGAEYPFSINRPPPLLLQESDSPHHLSVPRDLENRLRGDSVSSASTDGSANPQLSMSGTTATSGSSMTSPGSIFSDTHRFLQPSKEEDTSTHLPLLDDEDEDDRLGLSSETHTITQGLHGRRSHTPININIRSISSHAQAEALVQAAQQSLFDLAGQPPSASDAARSASTTSGWTPLSAKLAAYGESLALERRLKKEEDDRKARDQQQQQQLQRRPSNLRIGMPPASSPPYSHRALDRQTSLEHKPARPRARGPKRPNTSTGTPTEEYPPNHAHRFPVRAVDAHHALHASKGYHMPNSPRMEPSLSQSQSRTRLPSNDLPSANHQRTSRPYTSGPELPSRPVDAPAFRTPPPSNSVGFERVKPEQDKGKSSQMGFVPIPSVLSPQPTTTSKPRFGGFKSLMQSLKGKP